MPKRPPQGNLHRPRLRPVVDESRPRRERGPWRDRPPDTTLLPVTGHIEAMCYYRTDTRSRVIATAMAEGIRSCGDNATLAPMDQYRRVPSGHVAVFYGFKGTGREVFSDYLAAGKHVVFVDLGYWCRRAGGRYLGYHRFSYDARHPSDWVMRTQCDDTRLRSVRKNPALEKETDLLLKPWRKRGRYILLAGMQKKSCDSYGLRYTQWEREALEAIRAQTSRPIIYRPKPNDDDAGPIDGTTFSTRAQKLSSLLDDCHAVVTHHSNVAVNAVIEGVPVFVHDGIAKPLAGPSLDYIESPSYPDDARREQWLRNATYWQWSVPEMKAGVPWRWFKQQGWFLK